MELGHKLWKASLQKPANLGAPLLEKLRIEEYIVWARTKSADQAPRVDEIPWHGRAFFYLQRKDMARFGQIQLIKRDKSVWQVQTVKRMRIILIRYIKSSLSSYSHNKTVEASVMENFLQLLEQEEENLEKNIDQDRTLIWSKIKHKPPKEPFCWQHPRRYGGKGLGRVLRSSNDYIFPLNIHNKPPNLARDLIL